MVSIYCYDILKTFQFSRKVLTYTPFLVKHKWGLLAVLLLGLTMLVLDLVFSVQSLYGKMGSNATLIPSIYILVVGITTIISLQWIRWETGKELSKIVKADEKRQNAAKSKVQTKNNNVQVILGVTELLMKYTGLTIVSRVLSIAGLVMVATGAYATSPVLYMFTFGVCFSLAPLLCSTGQILTVIEITPSTRQTKAASTVGSPVVKVKRLHHRGKKIKPSAVSGPSPVVLSRTVL